VPAVIVGSLFLIRRPAGAATGVADGRPAGAVAKA
jgi:hypothetical protein